MKTAAERHSSNMKTIIRRTLTPRRLAGIFVVAFVLASALVGYESQFQGPSTASLGAYGGVNVLAGVANGTVGPEAFQPITLYSTIVASQTAPAGSYSTSFGGRMIESEAYMTIEVSDVQGASDQATQLVSSLNGYVASSSFDGSSVSLVLRIPESNFSSAMRRISGLGVVKAESISSNDVTDQYVNLQAQLDSYTAEETTLLRILNSSTTVNDALDTENAIQNTQAQINYLEGQLLVMQHLVAFATINIQFTEAAKAKTPTLDFGDALNSALLAFYTVTSGMLILGGSLVPIAMVGGLVYVPYRHFSRKKPKPTEAQ
jgi:hypothetical protein